MLFRAPSLDETERGVVRQIADLKEKLRWRLHEPRRWVGSLRRLSFARNIQGSNSIEGYEATLAAAAAVAVGAEPLDTSTETRLALEGYRDAMTYVLQLASEPDFEYTEQLRGPRRGWRRKMAAGAECPAVGPVHPHRPSATSAHAAPTRPRERTTVDATRGSGGRARFAGPKHYGPV